MFNAQELESDGERKIRYTEREDEEKQRRKIRRERKRKSKKEKERNIEISHNSSILFLSGMKKFLL